MNKRITPNISLLIMCQCQVSTKKYSHLTTNLRTALLFQTLISSIHLTAKLPLRLTGAQIGMLTTLLIG
jgi:hypothetical protein